MSAPSRWLSGYNSNAQPSFFFLIKTHNCTLLALHTSFTVVTILTMLTMLLLLQFILLTYNTYFTEVDNTTHHRHSADTSIRK